MKYRVTEEELKKIVSTSLSIADICRAINIRPNGSNYRTIKLKINQWNIDISHFTGCGWNVGDRYKPIGKKTIPLVDVLIENSTYMNIGNLKKRLINEGLKENKCEKCKIETWLNEKISFELHHINENNMDNRIENLILLCPNCHSQMHRKNNIKISSISEFRKNKFNKTKEKKEQIKSTCLICNKINKRKRNNFCSTDCYNIYRNSNSKIPKIDELVLKMNICNSICEIARQYSVSDNTIRKWLKKYNLLNCFKKS